MTDQHPITPTVDLIRKWNEEAATAPMADQRYIATQAARWGADQELEACCDVIFAYPGLEHPELLVEVLRDLRRPKPPSLKEQALAVIENSEICDHLSTEHATILRRALEQLND